MALPRVCNVKICLTICTFLSSPSEKRCGLDKTRCKKFSTLKSEFEYFHFFGNWRMIFWCYELVRVASVQHKLVESSRLHFVHNIPEYRRRFSIQLRCSGSWPGSGLVFYRCSCLACYWRCTVSTIREKTHLRYFQPASDRFRSFATLF